MFSFSLCAHPGCHDYVTTGSKFCFRHAPDPKRIEKSITDMLLEKESEDICVTGMEFRNLDLTDRRLVASNFAFCTFSKVDFSKTKFVSDYFDFCLFDRCLFRDIDCRYSIFSGSKILECDFSGSFIVHSNFTGVDAAQSDFSSCDLYYSAFSESFLTRTKFEDCNLTRADFRFCDCHKVSFRYSNLPGEPTL